MEGWKGGGVKVRRWCERWGSAAKLVSHKKSIFWVSFATSLSSWSGAGVWVENPDQEGGWDMESGFACIDRSATPLASPIQYFSRDSLDQKGLLISGDVYPEFLDTLTIPTVYKDNKIMTTDNYVDMQIRAR